MTSRSRTSARSTRPTKPDASSMRTCGCTSRPGTPRAMARSTDSNGLAARPSAASVTRRTRGTHLRRQPARAVGELLTGDGAAAQRGVGDGERLVERQEDGAVHDGPHPAGDPAVDDIARRHAAPPDVEALARCWWHPAPAPHGDLGFARLPLAAPLPVRGGGDEDGDTAHLPGCLLPLDIGGQGVAAHDGRTTSPAATARSRSPRPTEASTSLRWAMPPHSLMTSTTSIRRVWRGTREGSGMSTAAVRASRRHGGGAARAG